MAEALENGIRYMDTLHNFSQSCVKSQCIQGERQAKENEKSLCLKEWETLVTKSNAINTVRHHVRFGDVLDIEFLEGNVQDLVVVAKYLQDFQNKNMSKFNIELSSVPDRENLVAEIWYENKMVAEVNKETEKFVIEFCLDEKISFMLDEFLEVLENAKRRILER